MDAQTAASELCQRLTEHGFPFPPADNFTEINDRTAPKLAWLTEFSSVLQSRIKNGNSRFLLDSPGAAQQIIDRLLALGFKENEFPITHFAALAALKVED